MSPMRTSPKPSDLRRVLVVYKTTPLERYLDAGELDPDAGGDGDRDEVVSRLEAGHREHQRSVDLVQGVLERSGLEVVVDSTPTKREAAKADLVLAVGGDGTFLGSALQVEDTPMLGVNSAPSWSVGHYCGAVAEDFAETLDRIRSGEEPLVPLPRIAVHIGPRRVAHDALNDVLVAHRVPSASTRSILVVGGASERQTSSGLWVSTASGSTGAMRSAGGDAMDPGDRRLQYRVREPYRRTDQVLRLTGGIVPGPVDLVARNPHLSVWLDGQSRGHRVALGERVSLSIAERPLLVFGYTPHDPPAPPPAPS